MAKIRKFDDFMYYLESFNDSVIVISFVLETTSNKLKSLVKKFILDNSKILPELKFIYYEIKEEDYNKMSIIKREKRNKGNYELYPKLYYYYNKTILIEVINIIDDSSMIKSLEEYIKKRGINNETYKDLEEMDDEILIKKINKIKNNKFIPKRSEFKIYSEIRKDYINELRDNLKSQRNLY